MQLIGNTICPYCQRARIALEDAGMAHEWVELDFTDKPDWFMALTPVGKVPVLRHLEGGVFESGAIVEYVNDLAAQRYLPADPLQRAQVRSWALYAERLHAEARAYFTARTDADMAAARQRLLDRLVRLAEPDHTLFIEGAALTLAGIHMAPLFVLLQALPEDGTPIAHKHASVAALAEQLLAQPTVSRVNSVDYRERFTRFVLSPDTAFARRHRSSTMPASATESHSASYLTRSA
jgi:glutathione S-transferase